MVSGKRIPGMRPSTIQHPPTWPAEAGAHGALDDPSTRILLIEDHELVAVSLAAVLESEGFLTRISLATSMESTLQCAADFLPEVVLLDLYLGECGRCSRVIDSERHSCHTPSRGSLAGSGLTGGGLPRLRRSYAPSSGAGWSDIRAESPTATGGTAGLRGRSSN